MQAERERKREKRRCEEGEKDRELVEGGRGPDGSERDGVSQPEECLSWQRRGSGTGSVQSSQVSPREGDILLRGAHVPRSFGALRRVHRSPRRFVIRIPLPAATLFLRSHCRLPPWLRAIRLHPPITPTPRRAHARKRTRVAREIASRSVSSSECRIAIA